MAFPVFLLNPLLLVFSWGMTAKSLALSPLLTPSGIYIHWYDAPWFFSSLNNLRSVNLCSYEKGYNHFTIFAGLAQNICISPILDNQDLHLILQTCLTRVDPEGKNHLSWGAGRVLPNVAQDADGCWLTFNLLSMKTTRSLFLKAALQ